MTENSRFNKTRKRVIYVDESGNPGLSKPEHNAKHPFFIMGFCYCKNPRRLNKKLYKLLLKLHENKLYPPEFKEIKFYPNHELRDLGYTVEKIKRDWEPHYSDTRERIAKIILDNSDGIFAGIVNKTEMQSKTWTSERVGNDLFEKSLFQNILPKLELDKAPSVVYDQGRLNPTRTKAFNQYMSDVDSSSYNTSIRSYSGTIDFRDINSIKMPGIWASDFIAGSFHCALKHNDSTYMDMLKPNYIGDGSFKLSD